jgi:DNA-binding transcriptional MerR regulator
VTQMDGRPPARLTIGEFSRMTYLSATTLRHYHAVGLLEPAEVDAVTGYRYYSTDQIADAHVVRRLRDLDMPIREVRVVVRTTDPAARNAVIAAHLAEMEQRLRATTDAVASLRDLLTAPVDVLDVRYRTVAPMPTWSITADVAQHEIHPWAGRTLRRLIAAVGRCARTGPPGALYEPPFFEDGRGKVTAFVPTSRHDAPPGTIVATVLPATDLAVGLHRGRLTDLDRSYGALGRVIAERGIGVDGPIREHFLGRDGAVHLVEVAWPIDRTRQIPPECEPSESSSERTMRLG